jgi:prepilin-type N-terminal cleavage/methylation domain-containing protein
MRRMVTKRGLTLIEMLVVITIIAALAGFGVPAVKSLLASFESEDSVRAMVQTALSSARAMAIEQQRYAGIRFQKASYGDGDGLSNPQYMIFIIHSKDKAGNLANGFRAVEGYKPIRVPDLFGVMDLTLVTRDADGTSVVKEEPVRSDGAVDRTDEVNDVTSFSVLFSPTGQLVTHEVRIRNRDGKSAKQTPPSQDDVFNTESQVLQKDALARRGMFLQDDYPQRGLGPESSRRSFVIYRTRDFEQAFRAGRAYTGYLASLAPKVLYLAPLNGAITRRD